jgi:uncharacterized SAM-binding protein YcdF (DUF218 family)
MKRRWLIVLLVTLASCGLILQYAGSTLVVEKPLDNPDVIVSLASHEWERLPAVARVARQQPFSTVLLTQPRFVTPYNCYDCSARVGRLVSLGIAANRIRIIPTPVGNTYEEATATLAYLGHPVSSGGILVVTSPYHAMRAYLCFRRVFGGSRIAVGVEPALPESPAKPGQWWRYEYDRRYVGYEWAALASYALRFRLAFVSFGLAQPFSLATAREVLAAQRAEPKPL